MSKTKKVKSKKNKVAKKISLERSAGRLKQ